MSGPSVPPTHSGPRRLTSDRQGPIGDKILSAIKSDARERFATPLGKVALWYEEPGGRREYAVAEGHHLRHHYKDAQWKTVEYIGTYDLQSNRLYYVFIFTPWSE